MHHLTVRITHTTAFGTPVVEHWLKREIVIGWSHVCYNPFMVVCAQFIVKSLLTIFFILLFKHLIVHVVRAFAHAAIGRRIDPSWGEPTELFLLPASAPQLVLQRPCMCYLVCGMVHIKEPLLLIGNSSLCGGRGFPFSLSEWSLTICLTPYNSK